MITSRAISPALSRLDRRLRVAFRVLQGADRIEIHLLTAMAVTATAIAWPFSTGVYAFVAVPGSLFLAALIRVNSERQGERRTALAAAGADRGDSAVITSAGPIAAAAVGALLGALGIVATGRAYLGHWIFPVAIAVVATAVLRPKWVDAPALGAGAAAAMVAALAVAVSAAGTSSTALVASTSGAGTAADPAGWTHLSLPVVAAGLVLVATQVAGRKLRVRSRR